MNAVLTQEARQDLFEILSRIKAENPFAAQKMAKEFLRKFRLLALQPGIGSRTQFKNTRNLPIRRRYRVLYESPPPRLVIQRVLHTARHWPTAELPDRRAQ